MAQYNFTTNIERRNPRTGNIYCIDRMTSDYAQAHPFDVDGFLENIYQEFAGTAYEETREALRQQWDRTIGCKNPGGDRTLYPNRNGACRPAAMRVWMKAGDYWRRGLRPGDVLPDMIPMHTITRTEDGWIALFPKDTALLESEERRVKSEELSEPADGDVCCNSIAAEAEAEAPQPDPRDERDDELERMRAELDALRQENARLMEEAESATAENQRSLPQRGESQSNKPEQTTSPRPRRQRKSRAKRTEPATTEAQDENTTACSDNSSLFTLHSSLLKSLALMAAACVACVVIYETGFLIPLGLIGLATSGLVK